LGWRPIRALGPAEIAPTLARLLERGTVESDIRVREHIRKICGYAIRFIDQHSGHHPHQVTPFRPSSCARRRFARTRPLHVAKTNLYKKTLNWFFLDFGARQICA
jgi:hypothetical protein